MREWMWYLWGESFDTEEGLLVLCLCWSVWMLAEWVWERQK